MILQPQGRIKQRLTLTAMQLGTIVGLEQFLQAHRLILACPRCVADGDLFLDTDNSPYAQEFKVDCQCRERRIHASDARQALDADGDLIASAENILKPVSLSIRCAERKCVSHPIEIERTPTSTILRCRCAKTTIHNPTRIRH